MRDCFERGLIPGPGEDERTFLERVTQLTVQPNQGTSVQEAYLITRRLFGFSVDWVPIFYSNERLPFWEGAATWIGQRPSIQLRENFKKGRYLGYRCEEVLAHEAVHAARVAFEEPRFEEVLAYRTSKSRLRRWIGPLFRKSWESIAFMSSLIPAFFGYFWIPLGVLGWLSLRLAWAQWTLQRCLKKLPLSLIVCLTDAEIQKFSSLPLADIQAYFQNDQTLRGRLVHRFIKILALELRESCRD